MRLNALRLLGVVAMGLVSQGGCADAESFPGSAVIVVSVQPGKPGAPVETIRVTAASGANTIEVSRRNFDGKTDRESRALPQEEFRALWRRVERDRLLAFKPDPRPGDVFDFGERRLQITASRSAAGDTSEARVDAAWDKPLRNAGTIEPFLNALAAAAAKHCRDVKLHYLK